MKTRKTTIPPTAMITVLLAATLFIARSNFPAPKRDQYRALESVMLTFIYVTRPEDAMAIKEGHAGHLHCQCTMERCLRERRVNGC